MTNFINKVGAYNNKIDFIGLYNYNYMPNSPIKF